MATPKPYLFRYATAIHIVGSIEVVIVAKSMHDLETTWRSVAPPDAKFNPKQVDEVKIARREG